MANVAATPMTRWKWPVTKSSLTAAATARSWRARKIPESPPERKSEMKPSAKSIAVLSCARAFHSVPSQLSSRIVAGNPSEEASSEKTSGENGFMPLENICWPQTQKPKTPTPHNARTTRRSFQTGLREKVEKALPKNGNCVSDRAGRLIGDEIQQRKKVRAQQPIREQADASRQQNAENQHAQNGVDEPSPHGQRQPRESHALRAQIDDGDAEIERVGQRRGAE